MENQDNDKSDISEKLLRTNLMELLGGKGIPELEKLKNSPTIPPEPPKLSNDGGEWGGNNFNLPQLRNSQVDEILSEPPAWLVRWGITVFFGVLLAIFAISWFIQYPDLVNSSLKVVSTNTPKPVTAKVEGRLMKLMVQDGNAVKKGEIIAYLESTANHEEVLKLEKTVDELIKFSIKNDFEGIHRTEVPLYFSLGELQKSYQGFQEAFVRSESSMSSGSYSKKKGAVGRDIGTLRNLQESTRRQLELQEKDLQMAFDEAESQKRLSEKGLVSKADARNTQSRYLSKKQSFEQAKNALDNNLMNQNQKQQELIELDKNITEQKNNLIQSINTLKSDIEAWKQRYIATATMDGKVNFLSSLQENQLVKTGQELLYILPEGGTFYGEMSLGQYNFGKVRKGQEVIVKFPSYPYQEFGTVRGQIDYISDIPKDTAYVVKVTFPNGLKTTSNRLLPFRNGMTATGEIITADKRLMERFLEDLLKIFKR